MMEAYKRGRKKKKITKVVDLKKTEAEIVI